MCGIVGGWKTELNESMWATMVDALSRRGPDDRGVMLSPKYNLCLAQRRLAIIELSPLGAQPMQVMVGSRVFWITFNGEIYNYQPIKIELEKIGHVFRGHSDTEVILHAYAEWGIACVEKFHGMFAFALWDESLEKLFLVRDRFGVKPLYYYENQGTVLFASELKALFPHSAFKKEINSKAVQLYFQYGYIPAPYTIFQNTYKLKPGTVREYSASGVHEHIFWQAEKSVTLPPVAMTESEALDVLEEKLVTSFKLRTVADVEVGIFLSGGVDSSLVAALLQNKSKQKFKTFTIAFPGSEHDESAAARRIANHLGTDHHEFSVSANDAREAFAEYATMFDEPFGDSSGIPTYILARYARQHVKVALAGDGGDELFGGYSKYRAVQSIMNTSPVVKTFLRVLLGVLGSRRAAGAYQWFVRLGVVAPQSNIVQKLDKLARTLRARSFSEIFSAASSYFSTNDLQNLLTQPTLVGADELFPHTVHDPAKQMQLWDLQTYLPDDILVKSDRTTMFAGVEGREPYLDQSVLDFISTVPSEITAHRSPKYLLKKVLARYVPTELLQRPKTGFRAPVEQWLQEHVEELETRYLNASALQAHGLLQVPFVRSMLARFKKGEYVNPDQLWLVVSFQMWYERWMK